LYIVNMTDITEQLEIERKLRDAYKKEISLNKLKSTFLANMSHEIRTPLNAIVGYSDLLEDDVKTMNYESSSRMTAYLKEGVNRLLKLVDNIVEVSLLESGNEEFELDRINLNKFINENSSTWIDEAKLKNVRIDFNLCNSNLEIEVNEEKLERAVKELVENAIKYNKEDGSIYISTSEDEDNNILQIADTGIGIEEDSLQKIFDLFEQVEQSGYTRKYEGAGLGLSLSNKLISFMNGKMSIASQINEGTTVTIIFPKNIKE
ncbi:MAG: HAMP domain-containing sensor histidine kinase, partial [Melioribacteraceae bacterium]|nr:HAMP domain-containing sensor histidine kinase [Melioribacteraceae bacterium]